MIRIEISLGREPTQSALSPHGCGPRARQTRGTGALLAVAAATLMFSFVPAPNLPNAAMLATPRALALAPAPQGRFDALPELRTTFAEMAIATTRVAFANVQTAADQASRADDEIIAGTAEAAAPAPADAEQTERAAPADQPSIRARRHASSHASAIADEMTQAAEVSPETNDEPAPTAPPSKPAPMSFSIARAISSGEETLINQVTDLLTAGNLQQADTALHTSHWPRSVPLAKLAARAALMDEVAPVAVTSTKAVEALLPLVADLDGEGQRLLAAALMKAERPSEAVGIYRALLKQTPSDAELWMGLALALDASGAARSAVLYAYQQARELSADARVQRLAELRIAALA